MSNAKENATVDMIHSSVAKNKPKTNTPCVGEQGRGNFHTPSRPAALPGQLVPPSGGAAARAKLNRLHFGPCQVRKRVSGPRSVRKLREANHNFTL